MSKYEKNVCFISNPRLFRIYVKTVGGWEYHIMIFLKIVMARKKRRGDQRKLSFQALEASNELSLISFL